MPRPREGRGQAPSYPVAAAQVGQQEDGLSPVAKNGKEVR
jgi:hypothetical protein